MNEVFIHILVLVSWDPYNVDATMTASRTLIASYENNDAVCKERGAALAQDMMEKTKGRRAKFFCLGPITSDEGDAAIQGL